jgi:hypothetical protein
MSAPNSLNKNHQDACYVAECARQVAVAAATTQSAINVASITFHRACAKTGLTNGVGVEPSMTALRSLGVTGS